MFFARFPVATGGVGTDVKNLKAEWVSSLRQSFSSKTTPRFPEDFDGGNLRSGVQPLAVTRVLGLQTGKDPARAELDNHDRILLSWTEY